MKTRYKMIVTALLSGTALLVAAQGYNYQQRGPAPFEAYDYDNDGVITLKEFDAFRNERRAAYAAGGRSMRNAAAVPAFEQIDINADGALSADEMAIQQNQRLSEKPYGKKTGMSPGPGSGMGRNMPTFGDFDLNGDGSMTEDEFTEARNQRISDRAAQGYRMRGLKNARPFTEIDQNGDGVVNESEFLQMQAQHRRARFQ